jgi:hypothetical protein
LPYEISVETERPTFPNLCVCCADTATTEYVPTQPGRPQGAPAPEAPLAFPYCDACLDHFKHWQRHANDTMVAVNLGIWGIAIPMMAGASGLPLAIGPALGAIFLFRSRSNPAPRLKATCTSMGTACRAVWYRRGTYKFSFANEAVAVAFRDANTGELTQAQD